MFRDRDEAGRRLAAVLNPFRSRQPVIIALPRGGVPVAAPIAAHLHAPIDALVVRKLGVPWQPEVAFGAVAEGDVLVLDEELIEAAGITPAEVDAVVARERSELARRVHTYRGERPLIRVRDRLVILVDDGLATGQTARAAIEHLRRRGARSVILAVPVAPAEGMASMGRVADALVALERPTSLSSIGEQYLDFRPTADAEVTELLARGAVDPRDRPEADGSPVLDGVAPARR
jgi:putative phosphoribosyl transferase